MTAPERETAGAVRSANVAHFLPPDWGRIARIAAPAIERLPREGTGTGLLVIVPDPGASVALARALASLPAATGRRIVAATSASRGRRLLAETAADVVIGAPLALAPLLASSTLKLGEVATVVLAAADDLDPEDPELVAVLTEVPRSAGRILTALAATPGVEKLLERHLHRARRVHDEPPVPQVNAAPPLRCLTVAGSPLEALPALLDEADAPSATIVAADAGLLREGQALLASLGYREGALARFSAAAVEANTALVVFLGPPSAVQWVAAIAAQPAQTVAIITPRDRSALEQLAHPAVVRPFVPRSTLGGARAAEARARAELRTVLSQGLPAREVLALEPLLVEHDGLEVAAAALRLLERTRASQGDLVRETEKRVRGELAAAAAADAPPRGRDDRPPRPFAPKGDRPPRSFASKGDRPSRPFAPKGDRPRGPRKDDDRPRGPRGPRSPR